MSKVNRPRRIDVNLGELDQIIDRSMRAPLSEAEGQKLKTALHAMAERLWWKRSTEKTSSILPPEAVPAEKSGESAPAGHGRHGAAAFTGANRVTVPHATLHSGDPCPECREGKVYRQKEPATLVRFVGQAPLEATVFLEGQLAEHKTEPNSGLGKAISYLLNHWPKLTLFLQEPGAPLDNNIVERALKKAVRACTPVFLPMTSRPWRCRTGPCGSMPYGGAG